MSEGQWREIAPGVHQAGVRLEELTPGACVGGVVAPGVVTVVQVRWHGSNAVTLTYQDGTGRSDHRPLYRDHERSLWLEEASRAYAFDGDPALFRLAARRCGSGWPPPATRCWRSRAATSTRCRTRSGPSTASCCRVPRCASCSPTTRAPAR